MKGVMEEVVIRIKRDATVTCEEIYTGNIVKSKFIDIEDLYTAIKASGVMVGIDSGILPEGCVFYRQDNEKNQFVVIKYKGKIDFCIVDRYEENGKYKETEEVFKDIPIPTMLFGFKVGPDGHVYERLITCIKGDRVRMSTPLCKYPFSNVFSDFKSCLGGNRLKNVKYLHQTESFPYHILSMKCNRDLYSINNNAKKLAYSDLLSHISEEGFFNDDLLVETNMTVKDFIEALTKSRVKSESEEENNSIAA